MRLARTCCSGTLSSTLNQIKVERCSMGKGEEVTEAALATDVQSENKHRAETRPRPFEAIPGIKYFPVVKAIMNHSPFGLQRVDRMMEASLANYRKYGKIWVERMGDTATVNIIDPNDVATVFKNDGNAPIRHASKALVTARKKYRRCIGIANMQGDEWRRVRRAVQSVVLKPHSLVRFVPDLNTISDDFVDLMKAMRNQNGEVPDFQNEIYKWSLESVWKVVMGTRLGCLEMSLDSKSEPQLIINATGDFFACLGRLMFGFQFHKYINTPTWRRFLHSQDTLFRTAQTCVEQTLDRLKALETKGGPGNEAGILMSLLANKELTNQEMAAMPVELIGGGIDTTSNSLVFNLYNLATNPDKQEKLQEEIMSVLPISGEITAGALQKMVYLKGCIKETFRMFPGGLGVSRITSKDMILSGYHIPAGTRVRSNSIAGLLEDFFPEPETFIPERWIRGHEMETQASRFTLLPFGHGVRMCLGRRMAEQELQVVLAKLVRHFRIEWEHGTMGMKFRILHVPDKPARFNFMDRQ
ncbi:cytochrome P450 10-like [Ptychodera flava]|uniref:cytochrome P450 10-like n=1 Tax=Ptychodera flava TaxID=63121 RepID=UPI00396A434B